MAYGKIESVDGTFLIIQFEEEKEGITLGEIEFIPKNDEQRLYIAQMIPEGMSEGQIQLPQEVISQNSVSKSKSKFKREEDQVLVIVKVKLMQGLQEKKRKISINHKRKTKKRKRKQIENQKLNKNKKKDIDRMVQNQVNMKHKQLFHVYSCYSIKKQYNYHIYSQFNIQVSQKIMRFFFKIIILKQFYKFYFKEFSRINNYNYLYIIQLVYTNTIIKKWIGLDYLLGLLIKRKERNLIYQQNQWMKKLKSGQMIKDLLYIIAKPEQENDVEQRFEQINNEWNYQMLQIGLMISVKFVG